MLFYDVINKILQMAVLVGLSKGITWKKSDVIVNLQPVDSVLLWFAVPHTGRGSITCCVYCETDGLCVSFTYNRITKNCTLFGSAFTSVGGNELTSTGNNYYIDSLTTTTSSTTTSTSTSTTTSTTSITTTTTTTTQPSTTTTTSGGGGGGGEEDDD